MVDWERKKRGRKKLRESDVLQEQRSNMRVYARTPPADTLKCQPQIFQSFMAPEVPLRKKTSLWWVGATLAWLWRNYRSLCQARVVPMPESGWQTSTHAYQVLVVLCGSIFKQVLSFYWVAASPVFNVSKAWRSKEIRQTLFWRTARPFQTIRGCLLCCEEVLGAVWKLFLLMAHFHLSNRRVCHKHGGVVQIQSRSLVSWLLSPFPKECNEDRHLTCGCRLRQAGLENAQRALLGCHVCPGECGIHSFS